MNTNDIILKEKILILIEVNSAFTSVILSTTIFPFALFRGEYFSFGNQSFNMLLSESLKNAHSKFSWKKLEFLFVAS